MNDNEGRLTASTEIARIFLFPLDEGALVDLVLAPGVMASSIGSCSGPNLAFTKKESESECVSIREGYI